MRIPDLTCAIALVVAVGAPALSFAQVQIIQGAVGGEQISIPGLGPGRQFKTGTGRIRGRVVSEDSGNPIRRAQVRIVGQEIAPKAALTDADGRFEFRDLPAGRMTLQASKSGYVSVSYGQTRPFESGRPIELADKQVLEDANITMPRGSVIAGRILDEFGEPVPDATVTALRQSWVSGRRRLAPAGGRIGQTNDLGQFRIYGLPPGDYYVSATLRSGTEMMAFDMMATGASGPGPSGSSPTSGYAPTYFPGTANAAEAQKLTLTLGQETASTDFALVPVRLARISGIVMSSEGKPLEGAMVRVNPVRSSEMGFMPLAGSARTTKDGAFTLSSVPPGGYTLIAQSMQVFTSDGGNTMMFRASIGGGGDGSSEFGAAPLSVGGQDLANVVLVTGKGGTAIGKLIFEDGAQPPSATSIRLNAFSTDMDMPGLPGGSMGSAKADGTFELKGVSGHRLIRAMNTPPGWTLKAVRLNGNDVTDTGIDFKASESVSGVEVVLTSKGTSVTGTVTGANGAAAKDCTVVIFSENPDHWRLPMTRWVSGTRLDQGGRFKFQNLPAGTYYAVAVDYVAQGEWSDPDLIERLRAKGKRVILDEGGTQTVDLKLADGY